MEPSQLITPPLDANSFEADGVVYTATESLSTARYKIFQKRQVELGFNGTFREICAQHDLIWADLNKMQLGAAAQKLGNLRDGITYAGSGRISGLEVCGLFFNAPDENAVAYDHQAMLVKLAKWEQAGITVDFFFLQAARRVSGFYERFTQSSLPAGEPLPQP
jgi:hypothetical protein